MSILQQIINEATSATCDVTRLLRLCQVLAARLKHDPLKKWVRSELEGYAPGESPPQYRILSVINRGHYVGANYSATYDIPLSVLPDGIRDSFDAVELTGCIAEYVDLASKSGDGSHLKMPWPVELAVTFASKSVNYGQCISAWRQISPSDLIGMMDQIKTRVLGFALDIEGEAPDAGNIPGVHPGVSSDQIAQFFTTNIQGNIGVLQTGADALAKIHE